MRWHENAGIFERQGFRPEPGACCSALNWTGVHHGRQRNRHPPRALEQGQDRRPEGALQAEGHLGTASSPADASGWATVIDTESFAAGANMRLSCSMRRSSLPNATAQNHSRSNAARPPTISRNGRRVGLFRRLICAPHVGVLPTASASDAALAACLRSSDSACSPESGSLEAAMLPPFLLSACREQ